MNKEIPFDIAHDFLLEVCLPFVGGYVKGHLGLNDALSDILHSSATWGRSSQVNKFVNLCDKISF